MGKKYYLLNSLPFLQLLRCKALGSILLELFVLIPELVHTINHLLDQLDLRVSEPVLVGDVVGVSGLATRFTTGATGLQVKLLATSLELVDAVLGPAGQVDVDGGPHASAKVGGAGVDVTVLLIQTEVLARLSLDRVLDSLDTLGQSAEHFPDISTLLHRDNTSWSSSLIQIRKVFSVLWKIPRPSGQSRSVPATVRFLSPETKRKWSSTSCWRTFSSIPVRG